MIYIIDTDSLSRLKHFFPRRFPTLWARLDVLVEEGRLKSVREVRLELDGLDSQEVGVWAKNHREIFLTPSDQDTLNVRRIFRVKHFQSLVGSKHLRNGRPQADAFLIAAAMSRSGCVVTEERLKENAPKTPNVCERFGVDYTNLEGMMEREGWEF